MQETTNYNLPYPEGTDIVNLLTILPELATSVDTQMKVNQDAGIQRGTHVKSGTVNAITVPNDLADGAFFTFVASDDFTEGDSFTFNGEVIGARVPSGKALKTGAFTINQNVLCCRYNGILTIFTNQADVAVDLSLNSLSNNAIANSAVSTTFAEVQQQIGNADISGVGANIKAAINALNATDGVQNSAIEEVKSNLIPEVKTLTINPNFPQNYVTQIRYVKMGRLIDIGMTIKPTQNITAWTELSVETFPLPFGGTQVCTMAGNETSSQGGGAVRVHSVTGKLMAINLTANNIYDFHLMYIS